MCGLSAFPLSGLISKPEYDRNGRLIAEIINKNGINVNQEIVRLGYAWHFVKYSDDETYAQIEKEARKNKVGLWQDPNPIAPWNWRNNKN